MTLSYIAGFFDGEGCIGFARCRTSLHPRVLVTNTNIEILEELKNRFGGDIKPLSLRKENWKQGFSLRLTWLNAMKFLTKIYPFLILKRRQAETVFAWDAIRPGRGSDPDFETMQLLADQMRWLNKKGLHSEVEPILKYIK